MAYKAVRYYPVFNGRRPRAGAFRAHLGVIAEGMRGTPGTSDRRVLEHESICHDKPNSKFDS